MLLTPVPPQPKQHHRPCHSSPRAMRHSSPQVLPQAMPQRHGPWQRRRWRHSAGVAAAWLLHRQTLDMHIAHQRRDMSQNRCGASWPTSDFTKRCEHIVYVCQIHHKPRQSPSVCRPHCVTCQCYDTVPPSTPSGPPPGCQPRLGCQRNRGCLRPTTIDPLPFACVCLSF